MRDLNYPLREAAALLERDDEPEGFALIDRHDAQRSVSSFVRRGHDPEAPLLSNFTPTVHRGFRLGVPRAGQWRERLNTDSAHYGGSDFVTSA